MHDSGEIEKGDKGMYENGKDNFFCLRVYECLACLKEGIWSSIPTATTEFQRQLPTKEHNLYDRKVDKLKSELKGQQSFLTNPPVQN